MSHHTGITSLTLSCQTIVFTPKIKHSMATQMGNMKTPMFHDWNELRERGRRTSKHETRFTIETIGNVEAISARDSQDLEIRRPPLIVVNG